MMRSFTAFSLIIILQACQAASPQHTPAGPNTSQREMKPTVNATGPEPPASQVLNRDEGAPTNYRGRYVNEVYGYSVEIPEGLVGVGAAPPAPNHGVSIVLSEEPEARIWIDGSYNSLFWSTLDEAAAAHVETAKRQASEVEVIGRSPTRLHNLTGTRITLRRKGGAVIEDIVLALRKTKDEVGIVYSLSLSTPESRYTQDKEVFDRVVQSWQARRLPE